MSTQLEPEDSFDAACARADAAARTKKLLRFERKPHNGAASDVRASTASKLEMRGITWLWPGRFALGKIGLIAGLPDYGKGQIAAFLAAAVTAGIELPCGEGIAPRGNV